MLRTQKTNCEKKWEVNLQIHSLPLDLFNKTFLSRLFFTIHIDPEALKSFL